MENKKRLMLFGAGLVVLIVAVFVVSQYFPPADEEDLTGTIGKAKRYRTAQMKSGDVVIKDEDITKLVQSAEFQNLAKNPDVVKMMQEGVFEGFVNHEGFKTIMANIDEWTELNELVFGPGGFMYSQEKSGPPAAGAVIDLVTNPDFQSLIGNPDFNLTIPPRRGGSGAVSQASFDKVVNSASFKSLSGNPLFKSAVNSGSFKSLVTSGSFKSMIGSPGFKAMLESPGLKASLSKMTFGPIPFFALSSPNFKGLVNNAGFSSVMGSSKFKSFVNSAQFKGMMKGW